MTQNSISKLLLATDESNPGGAKVYINDTNANEDDTEAGLELADEEIKILEETIPYQYVNECLQILKQLNKRLQSDIYRGILLEVVQRIITDVQVNLMQGESVTSSSLLLAHAHFAFIFKEFLSSDSVLASPLMRRNLSHDHFNQNDIESNRIETVVSLDGQED